MTEDKETTRIVIGPDGTPRSYKVTHVDPVPPADVIQTDGANLQGSVGSGRISHENDPRSDHRGRTTTRNPHLREKPGRKRVGRHEKGGV